jgi:hypothetical protein
MSESKPEKMVRVTDCWPRTFGASFEVRIRLRLSLRTDTFHHGLHRLAPSPLGHQPGPLSDQMLDEAVELAGMETDDLDWKGALPQEKELAQSDAVKDVDAMAHSGGGLIVFGWRSRASRQPPESTSAWSRRVSNAPCVESP